MHMHKNIIAQLLGDFSRCTTVYLRFPICQCNVEHVLFHFKLDKKVNLLICLFCNTFQVFMQITRFFRYRRRRSRHLRVNPCKKGYISVVICVIFYSLSYEQRE